MYNWNVTISIIIDIKNSAYIDTKICRTSKTRLITSVNSFFETKNITQRTHSCGHQKKASLSSWWNWSAGRTSNEWWRLIEGILHHLGFLKTLSTSVNYILTGAEKSSMTTGIPRPINIMDFLGLSPCPTKLRENKSSLENASIML